MGLLLAQFEPYTTEPLHLVLLNRASELLSECLRRGSRRNLVISDSNSIVSVDVPGEDSLGGPIEEFKSCALGFRGHFRWVHFYVLLIVAANYSPS